MNNSEQSSAKPAQRKQPLKRSQTGTAGFVQQREPASEQKYRRKTPQIGHQKLPHQPLQFYTILRNFQLFLTIPEQTVKSPVQRKQPRKPSER